jgi:MATE family multidrug resistance protein
MKLRKNLFKTLALAWPIAFTQLGAVLMGTIDTVMVGKLGPVPLASMAMSNTLWYFNLVLVFGIISATSPMISAAYGAEKYEKIAPLASHGLRLALVLSFISIFVFTLSIPIFQLFKQNAELIENGREYLFYFSFGIPAHYGFFSLRIFAASVSDTRPALSFMILGLLTNILFNYLFIYGTFGFPAMGIAGAGMATSIVGWIMFLGMLTYVSVSKEYKRYRIIKEVFKLDFKLIKKIVGIGLPIGAANFCEVSFFMFATLLIGTMGTVQLAAHQIALNLASTTFMIASGVAQATSIQIGQARGRNKYDEILGHAANGYALVFFFMIVVTVMFLTIPGHLISIYTTDASIIETAIPLLMIASGFQILDGFQVVGIGASKGLQDTRVPFINTVIAFWLFGMPASFVFSRYMGMASKGVWWGLIAGLGVAALLHAHRFYKVLYRDFAPAPAKENALT